MAQAFEDDFGGRIAERVQNVDVRLPREFSREVAQEQRDQGRIDWRARNGENMKKIAAHEITPIYR